MALTPSTMLPLGTKAPDFSLIDIVSQQKVFLNTIEPKVGLVVMFICNHCPYVKHILDKLLEIIIQYQKQGIEFIAINSNDVLSYPEDRPEKMRELAIQRQFSFPYLFDETQEVARQYQAACTPDFFVFDKNKLCVYRGRFDDTSPGKLNAPVTGKDLSRVLDHLLTHQNIDSLQYPSMGCNIKWKK